ncbi:GntR family transcriptional regulator [Bordetella petrii]|uniref:GntR family transcriptional regulator n=1 Tax=Bordetella petrii TaxID=94624 RepID=UPI001E2FF0E2|nr:GntR family transcriptional regulator [Bordetella petrii]MCD0504744.1 GntR family transcriptional regulator [Bordetella petrii]
MLDGKLYARSRQPLYLQVAALFRSNIHNRNWPPGQRVPSLPILVEQYEVARSTVRQAFDVLESEGLIHRSRGSGTFVSTALPQTPTLLIPKSWDETVALSNQLGTISLTESNAGLALPDNLGMPCEHARDGRFQYLRRIHTADAGPFCYSEVYLDSALFRKHRARIRSSTVAPVLDEFYGHRLTHARQVLNVIEAGRESAEALQIPVSAPVAELRRYACIEQRVVYFARLEFPFQKIRMEFDLLAAH